MTPEAKVKARVRAKLDGMRVWYFMPVSNGMGRHGIPDFICCINGRFVAIECKAGKGEVTALQRRELERIEAAGGDWIVAREDTKLDLLDLI